jgi:hypothetical protein
VEPPSKRTAQPPLPTVYWHPPMVSRGQCTTGGDANDGCLSVCLTPRWESMWYSSLRSWCHMDRPHLLPPMADRLRLVCHRSSRPRGLLLRTPRRDHPAARFLASAVESNRARGRLLSHLSDHRPANGRAGSCAPTYLSYGATCSIVCASGFFLSGGPYRCQSGQWIGAQACSTVRAIERSQPIGTGVGWRCTAASFGAGFFSLSDGVTTVKVWNPTPQNQSYALTFTRGWL